MDFLTTMKIFTSGYSQVLISTQMNSSLYLHRKKNRSDVIYNWDAVIDWGDEWFYFPGNSAPTPDWQYLETDISFWSTGNSGFGYGDNDDNTNISQVISLYVRKDFLITDASNIAKALFHLDYDDGYVAYINGVEFSRRNLGCLLYTSPSPRD